MRFVVAFWLAIVVGFSPVWAADRIGLVLPFEGRFAPTANLIRQGVEAAFKDAGSDAELVIVANDCDSENIAQDVESLGKVHMVIGPLCFDNAKNLAAALKQANNAAVPVLAIGPRSPLLRRARDHDELPLFVLGKDAAAEADALVNLALPQFEGKPFAIVDDGSVHGRALADAIRLIGEERGQKAAAVANFRPFQSNQRATIRRLARSNVEALIIAGEPEDIETIAKDLKNLKKNWRIAVGDQAALLPFMADAISVPDNAILVRESQVPETLAPNLSAPQRLHFARGVVAGQIAQAVLQGNQLKAGASYQTGLGTVTFSSEGRASILPYESVLWETIKPRLDVAN